MASFTIITVKGEGHLGLTIDESVGLSGGANWFGDVMLVQALLAYVLPLRIMDLNDPRADVAPLPPISGQCDFETDAAIDYYQRSRSQFTMASDGMIDAPSYGRKVGNNWVQRNLVNIYGNKLMTMTVLHFEARKAARQYAHGRYTTGLTLMFPQLRQILKGSDHERMYWLK
jgi:hypothetical protein